jgi:N-acetylglucosaminyldiphosphoundecaprenol N-acetyl-beta-D-mannosaminyltransferase
MSQTFESVNILGTEVTVASFEDTLHALEEMVINRTPVMYCAATVYSVMPGTEKPEYQAIVNQASFVMADGMPLVWASHILGYRDAERVHGDDLMLACCDRFKSWKHYLLGGAPGQPEVVAEGLQRWFTGIQIVGTSPTPVRPVPGEASEEIVDAIQTCEADIVWVGMGTPWQDQWMATHLQAVARPMVGVGSAFNILAGYTRPTPNWMKQIGLQWLHRFIQEPRRLTRRYVVYNPKFIYQFIRELVTNRHKELDV